MVEWLQGRTVGQFITEEIASPLGIEMYLGVPDSEKHRMTDMHRWPLAYIAGESLLRIVSIAVVAASTHTCMCQLCWRSSVCGSGNLTRKCMPVVGPPAMDAS